jgi:RNA polymerase sigma-70 factor (ECF subfamily)
MSADGAPSTMDAEELKLRERARAGDRDALGLLLDRHAPRLRSAVIAAGVGSAEAEDVVHEAIARALEHWTGLRTNGALEAWLSVIARNAAIDWLRRRRREQQHIAEPGPAVAADVAEQLRPAASSAEGLSIPGLTAQAMAILRLRYEESLSGPEIAARLGISLEAAKKRLQRAREAALAQLRRRPS